MDTKKTELSLVDLTAKVKTLVGKNRLISIAYIGNSPKQAADISRRLGFDEETVKKIRFASIIKRDYGLEEFNKIFQPYTLIQIPKFYSGANIIFNIHDINKRADDFLNPKELLYIIEKIEEVCNKENVKVTFSKPNISKLKQSQHVWIGNRLKKEFSNG